MIMKVKTTDLIGPALDYAVAKCEGSVTEFAFDGLSYRFKFDGKSKILAKGWAPMSWYPSSNWVQGGSLIEREGIYLRANDTVTEWAAGALRKNRLDKKPGQLFYAKTPLVAAMRCFVASKLGDEIEIPEELLK